MNKARTELGYRTDQWFSADGHKHTSIPTDVPEKWSPRHTSRGLSYFSQQGTYEIRRESTGSHRSYTVWRNDEELVLSFTGSLKEAKARAVRTHRGRTR